MNRFLLSLFLSLLSASSCCAKEWEKNLTQQNALPKKPMAPIEKKLDQKQIQGQEDQKKDQKADEEELIDDSFEGWNRAIFSFNQMLNQLLWQPIGYVYEIFVPEIVQKGIRNLLNHACEPLSLVNSLLQFDADKTTDHLVKILINSTFGLGGLIDVVGTVGLNPEKEDFGKTLKKMGVGAGPFVMLPLLGPSNLRDSFSTLFDVGAQFPLPFYTMPVVVAHTGTQSIVTYLDYKETLNEMERNFDDAYIIMRNAYYESRGDIEVPDVMEEDDAEKSTTEEKEKNDSTTTSEKKDSETKAEDEADQESLDSSKKPTEEVSDEDLFPGINDGFD